MKPGAGLDDLDRLVLAACLRPFTPAGEGHDLLALLHHRLADSGGRLAGIARRTWVENGLALKRFSRALESLEASGIDVLVADDVAVAELYELPRARPLRRLRAIVPAAGRAAVTRTLTEAGWSRQPVPRGVLAADPDSDPWVDTEGGVVEVGWNLGRDLAVPGADRGGKDLWAGSAGAVVPGLGRIRRLGTVHLLVWLLGDPGEWLPRARLLRLADTAIALSGLSDADRDRLVAELARRHLVPAAMARLQTLDGVVPGTVPPPLVAALAATPARRRDRLAAAIQPTLPVLARHLHTTAELPAHQALRRLPAALRDSWGLDSVREVPGMAAGLARTRGRQLVGW